jgi:hypothetical protein
VSLDFMGTSPRKIAEWALAPWLMYVPQVPLELLDPHEISIAICTCRPHPAAHAGTFSVPVAPLALSDYMLSNSAQTSAGLGLGYVSMHHTTRRLAELASYGGMLDCGPNWTSTGKTATIAQEWSKYRGREASSPRSNACDS